MRRRVVLEANELMPEVRAVLETQGVPQGTEVGPKLHALAEEAVKLVQGAALPRGVEAEVEPASFFTILKGEGNNEPETPLHRLRDGAQRMALFAVTLGEDASELAGKLFQDERYALAMMVDATAQLAKEAAIAQMEDAYVDRLEAEGVEPSYRAALAYLPGQCGWHATGHRALFRSLGPEDIGIHLDASCHLYPLKSAAGVIIAGDPIIHCYRSDFAFCDSCGTRHCRDRQRRIVRRLALQPM